MLIWLGKQRLGQRDRFEAEHSAPAGKPVVIVLPPIRKGPVEEQLMALPEGRAIP